MTFQATLRLATRPERRALLDKIYAPFKKLEKDSQAYLDLAKSGRVWEDYHQPGDSEKMGYAQAQTDICKTLAEIDLVRKQIRRPISKLVHHMKLIPAYAHQSVMIERNRLPASTSFNMYDELQTALFSRTDIRSLPIRTLADKTNIPQLQTAVTDTPRTIEESIELRNHLIVSQWIAETANTSDRMNEDDIRCLSTLAMKDLDEGGRGFYPWTLGPRTRLGEYRQTPIGVRSNPMAVFPYHLEVPACMGRFFEWRARRVGNKEETLHPLVMACHAMVYFLQIHPFVDGNGRVSRLMMQHDIMRQGYLPSYLTDLTWDEYLKMIRHAADGEPTLLVDRYATAQLELLTAASKEDGTETQETNNTG